MSLNSYITLLGAPLVSLTLPVAFKSGGVLSIIKFVGSAVAVKRTDAPQSVAKDSLFGPSISLITNL